MKALTVTGLFAAAIAMLYACQSEQQMAFKRYYSAGQLVYQTHCQNCHGNEGQGLANLIPPLSDAGFLTSNSTSLPCYLQNGLKDTIIIHNKPYNGQMPPANLAPVEIAQVLTYVQNSFGNQLGLYETKQVEDNLKQCK